MVTRRVFIGGALAGAASFAAIGGSTSDLHATESRPAADSPRYVGTISVVYDGYDHPVVSRITEYVKPMQNWGAFDPLSTELIVFRFVHTKSGHVTAFRIKDELTGEFVAHKTIGADGLCDDRHLLRPGEAFVFAAEVEKSQA